MRLFSHAIEAEVIADRVLHGGRPWLTTDVEDFDRDGRDEVLVETETANYYLSPGRGGALFEWDLKAPAVNLITAMTRRPEAYHKQIESRRCCGGIR